MPPAFGLGSSSSFTVGLLHALYPHAIAGAKDYAEMACEVELGCCHKPIGKQDQYTAAFGGINLLGFTSNGVTVNPIDCDLDALSAHCLLLDTGMSRQGDAGAVLAAQQQDRDDVRELARLAEEFAHQLNEGELLRCGVLMSIAWDIKRRFVANKHIDTLYWKALAEGAWGGKLCGAGGGGFLLFLAPPEKHQGITQALGLRHVPIHVGVKGCEVVYASV